MNIIVSADASENFSRVEPASLSVKQRAIQVRFYSPIALVILCIACYIVRVYGPVHDPANKNIRRIDHAQGL